MKTINLNFYNFFCQLAEFFNKTDFFPSLDGEIIAGVLSITLTACILAILLIVSILSIKRKKKDMEIASLLNPARELTEWEKKRNKEYKLFEKLEYQYRYNSPFPDNLKIPYNGFDKSSPGHLTFFDLWDLQKLIQTKAYPLSEFLFSFKTPYGVEIYKKNTTECPPVGWTMLYVAFRYHPSSVGLD